MIGQLRKRMRVEKVGVSNYWCKSKRTGAVYRLWKVRGSWYATGPRLRTQRSTMSKCAREILDADRQLHFEQVEADILLVGCR